MTLSDSLNRRVFIASSLLIALIMVATTLSPMSADKLFSNLQKLIVTNVSWIYVLIVAFVVIITVYFCCSRIGRIKLGEDDCEPSFSFSSWLAMLFAAGMGIGLMFYGVAEPLIHYTQPPSITDSNAQTTQNALVITFLHWGLHGWAIYAVMGLSLAYFAFRKRQPLTFRAALYPIIKNKIYSWIGDAVDVFAVIGTVFGIATSLGIGAMQINAGLSYLFETPVSAWSQIAIMVVIVIIAMFSVVLGLDKGIKRLSEANMLLAVLLLLFVLMLGTTVSLLEAFIQNIGHYLNNLVANTFNLNAYKDSDWLGNWTIFYWGWWLAWAPFVGLFIARISKGRTIREFILGVVLVPSVFTMIWMTVFGNSAIELVQNNPSSTLVEAVNENTPIALFLFLETMPFSEVVSVVALLMVVVFFVTSCDSGAMVVNMICCNGDDNAPLWQRVYWCIGVGVVAIILLTIGGLNALQTMTIAAALPFSIVLFFSVMGLLASLHAEIRKNT